MNNNDRFCFFIIGQGINGSCYGACFVYGYGSGGTARYHHADFGNFSITVGNEDRSFTITTVSGNNVQTYIMNFEGSDNYSLTIN